MAAHREHEIFESTSGGPGVNVEKPPLTRRAPVKFVVTQVAGGGERPIFSIGLEPCARSSA